MANLLGTDYIPNYTPTQDEKTIALITHLSFFIFPFIAPLVIYIIKKNESAFIAAHAKAAFNFHVAGAVAFIICFILIFLLIGIPLMVVLGIYGTALTIVGTIRASEGRIYEYPFTINLIQ
jgi:uncharacterized Tic20 family protein